MRDRPIAMSGKGAGDTRELAELRDRIDVIDAEMHRLLVQRGAIIDALVRAKATDRIGAAFRPAREADMMRRLVARHEGALPLATVEHMWREIITTFTRMQAPFDVAIDGTADAARMRDLARFYFGFSVDLIGRPNAAAVVDHVAESGDIGVVAWERQPARAWWRALAQPSGPRIMAVLPYIKMSARPADLPAFVISPQLADAAETDIRIVAVSTSGDFAPPQAGCVLAETSEDGRREILLAVPAGPDVAPTSDRATRVDDVGGVARGIAVDAPTSTLYEKADAAGTST
jgi:chorismate mutase